MVDFGVKVVSCEPLSDFRLKVVCSDGAQGVFDMSGYVGKGAFAPLTDKRMFDDVRLVFGVPTWANGADIAAERVRSDMVCA